MTEYSELSHCIIIRSNLGCSITDADKHKLSKYINYNPTFHQEMKDNIIGDRFV